FDGSSICWLANYLFEESEERRGGALSNNDKIRLYLRFCADPGFQNGIATDIGVHQATVSRTIADVAKRISAKASEWIKFPKDAEEIKDSQMKWQAKYSFPFAIGVIDCTHIKIKKPTNHSDEYICRKGFHSINVQATCDGNELFTSVDISWPGSVHDSRILRNSEVFRIMQNATNDALLLGDEGYGICPWLMTPFRNPTTDIEKTYNKVFTRERVIIERCFGQLKQRFSILQYKIRVSTELAPHVIASCFILHNIAKFLNDDYTPISDYNNNNDEWHLGNDIEQQSASISEAGKNKRRIIANLLSN
ncbi:putative nuclease HARBI1, partial [Musca vetustissima]|uniref:putative nuclease HARBI1 n=1 Tax=Musca vetustissima TaxID=27455 RepID=UPI002AB736A8